MGIEGAASMDGLGGACMRATCSGRFEPVRRKMQDAGWWRWAGVGSGRWRAQRRQADLQTPKSSTAGKRAGCTPAVICSVLET